MTATDWIDNLERKAKAATPGDWEVRRDSGCSWIAAGSDEDPTVIADYLTVADAKFIAAANPTNILRLIEDNRRLSSVIKGHEAIAAVLIEDNRRMRHGSLCPECNAKAWGERADFRRERDELAARLAAVEALADETERAGDPLLRLDRLRAALSTAPTDTTKEN